MKRRRLIALVAALGLVATGCDWAQFRADVAHSGFQASETSIGTNNVASLASRWTTPTGGAIDSSPAVVNGVVYIGSDDTKMYALDATTGAIKWTTTTGGPIDSSPAVVNGVVYIGSDDTKMYALDATTGAIKWTTTTGGPIDSSPTVANGVVYIGSQDANLYALDATTGSVKWATTTGGPIDSSPAVANGVVYIGSDDANVYALDATTGSVKWATTTGGPIDSSPAVMNGVVYIGSQDANLYALDATTGSVKWTTTTGGPIDSSPAVANGAVYIGSHDAKAYALNATTGAIRWTTTTGGVLTSSPAVMNGIVYIGSQDTKMYALDAVTGAVRWTTTTGGPIDSSPAVANGAVYIASRDATTYSYQRWVFTRPTCPPNPHAGLSPCQLQDAYRLPSQVAGAGRTVAIVDAYDDPNAESDLAVYRATYGLPPCTTANGCFRKLNQSGVAGSYPAADPAWAVEISLDLDTVSAICPLCNIILVEARDNSLTNLSIAEDTAAAQHPTAISNSFGASEFIGEQNFNGHFTHAGIMTTASTGDHGYGTSYPASAPGVVAVGGTELTADNSAHGWTETAWSGAGSGCSSLVSKPGWRHDASCAKRTIADVSALAGSPGATIYNSYSGHSRVRGDGGHQLGRSDHRRRLRPCLPGLPGRLHLRQHVLPVRHHRRNQRIVQWQLPVHRRLPGTTGRPGWARRAARRRSARGRSPRAPVPWAPPSPPNDGRQPATPGAHPRVRAGTAPVASAASPRGSAGRAPRLHRQRLDPGAPGGRTTMTPTIDEIIVGDEPDSWRAAGFAVDDDGTCRIGTVRVRLVGRDARQAHPAAGRCAASTRPASATTASTASPPPSARRRRPSRPCTPTASRSIDHVVLLSPDTAPHHRRPRGGRASTSAASRETDSYGAPMRQTFFRAGEVIIELIGPDEPGEGATALLRPGPHRRPTSTPPAALLGAGARRPKDAVQPGRRIASLRHKELDVSVATAFMSPEPGR